jgi:hypothetical protein
LGEFTARFGDCAFTLRTPNLDDLFLTLAAEAPGEGSAGAAASSRGYRTPDQTTERT